MHCGYSSEPPRRDGLNAYLQSMIEQKYEKISEFLSENVFGGGFYIYLNRRVFALTWSTLPTELSQRRTKLLNY